MTTCLPDRLPLRGLAIREERLPHDAPDAPTWYTCRLRLADGRVFWRLLPWFGQEPPLVTDLYRSWYGQPQSWFLTTPAPQPAALA